MSETTLITGLRFLSEQKAQTVIMDSAVVFKKFRGNGLQGKMLAFCLDYLKGKGYHYYMCTIHPDNQYSLHNMQGGGFEIVK